jgi:hypothetical protein
MARFVNVLFANESQGIRFRDLVSLAEHLVLFSVKPKVALPIFAELARLTLG